MISVRSRVTGAGKLRAQLDNLGEEAIGLVDKENLGSFLLTRMQRRYVKQVDPNEVRWKPLSPRTKRSSRILFKRGVLFNSIKVLGKSERGLGVSTGAGFRIGVVSRKVFEPLVEGGSRVVDPSVYGRAHQRGLGRVPRRRFIGIGPSDRKAVREYMRRAAKRLVRELA